MNASGERSDKLFTVGTLHLCSHIFYNLEVSKKTAQSNLNYHLLKETMFLMNNHLTSSDYTGEIYQMKASDINYLYMLSQSLMN